MWSVTQARLSTAKEIRGDRYGKAHAALSALLLREPMDDTQFVDALSSDTDLLADLIKHNIVVMQSGLVEFESSAARWYVRAVLPPPPRGWWNEWRV